VIRRGDICWVDLGVPAGSRPAKRRPVLVVQSNSYNASRLATVIAVVITSNTSLAAMPGNVFLPAVSTGLRRDTRHFAGALGATPVRTMANCGPWQNQNHVSAVQGPVVAVRPVRKRDLGPPDARR